MSYLFPNYKRGAIDLVQGSGNQVFDQAGKVYLDFTSGIGVCGLGYDHPTVKAAVQEQLDAIWHVPNLYTSQIQEEVAQKLVGDEYVAFFCNSGAEANEAAIKLARKATGRPEVITFLQSFHGRTYGAMSATGQDSIHQGFEPLVPAFTYVPYNELEPLKQALSKQTAAIMLELIQGEGGVLPADLTWVSEVAKLCQENGTLLIVDEVQTGIGRTGTFYAYEGYGIEPDIVTLAKGLANGLPVGAMLGKKALAEAFGPGSHGTTFGGNKVALSSAKVVIELINQTAFLQTVQEKSHYAFEQIQVLFGNSPYVKDVRGKGLMIGIELSGQEILTQLMAQLEAKGLLVLRAGQNVLRLLPPLTITYEELDQGLSLIQQTLQEMEGSQC